MSLHIAPPIREALHAGQPVVALESTVVTHGLPRPRNLALARRLEQVVRQAGATPATVGVVDGELVVGIDDAALERLAHDDAADKASLWNLAALVGRGASAGTTVAVTVYAAARAGIPVFATGGIGGVHEQPFDESADLGALARYPVLTVCAGPKSILDAAATLERLESLGVPVVGFRSARLAGFVVSEVDLPLPARVDTPREAAHVLLAQRALHLGAGVVLSNPVSDGLEAADFARLAGPGARGSAGQRHPRARHYAVPAGASGGAVGGRDARGQPAAARGERPPGRGRGRGAVSSGDVRPRRRDACRRRRCLGRIRMSERDVNAQSAAPGSERPPGGRPQGLGDMLVEARQRKALELSDVAELTHVRLEYLRALEEGRYQDLPEDVYSRNYVRLYAQAVGLDEAAVLDSYGRERRRAVGMSTLEQRLEQERRGEVPARDRRPGLPFGTLLPTLLLVVVLVGLAVWGFNSLLFRPTRPPAVTLGANGPTSTTSAPNGAGSGAPAGTSSGGASTPAGTSTGAALHAGGRGRRCRPVPHRPGHHRHPAARRQRQHRRLRAPRHHAHPGRSGDRSGGPAGRDHPPRLPARGDDGEPHAVTGR